MLCGIRVELKRRGVLFCVKLSSERGIYIYVCTLFYVAKLDFYHKMHSKLSHFRTELYTERCRHLPNIQEMINSARKKSSLFFNSSKP